MDQNYIDEVVTIEKEFPNWSRFKGEKRKGLIDLLSCLVGVGELADQYKKHIAYSRTFDMEVSQDSAEQKALDIIGMLQESGGKNLHVSQETMRLFHGALGIYTEAAELLEATAKAMATGEADRTNILEEMGDVSFYMAVIYDAMGFSPKDSCEANLDKLIRGPKARYRAGFSSDAAVNRDTDAEREGLEKSTRSIQP